jgi:hypothetical protein
MTVNYLHHSYRSGIQKEKRVIEFLKASYPSATFHASTMSENVDDDIDCWMQTECTVPGTKGVPISIKTQHNTHRYNNVGLETHQFINNEWEATGWYSRSKAKRMVIWNKDGVVWEISKARLDVALMRSLVKQVYRRQLREETCIAQVGLGHVVVDAESVYLDRNELVSIGVARILGTLPFDGMLNTKPVLKRKKTNV